MTQNNRIIKLSLFLCFVFFATLFLRSGSLFLHPRLWAEEGSYYYYSLQDTSIFSPFFLTVRSNFQLLTNLVVYFSTLVPARYAAYVTTYLSLLVSFVFIGFFSILSIQNKWPTLLSVILVISFALLPQGYEIYLTATNIQWILSATMLFICIADYKHNSNAQNYFVYIISLIYGLTGVCSAMTAPFFFLKWRLDKEKPALIIGIILLACILLHLTIIVGAPHPDRNFSKDLFSLTFPMILQTMFSPIFGGGTLDLLLTHLGKFGFDNYWYSLFYIVFLIAIFFLYLATKTTEQKSSVIVVLFTSWMAISITNIFGSIGSPASLISGWGGGRYFFYGAICFMVLLAMAYTNKLKIVRYIALTTLLLITSSGVREMYAGDWKGWLISGPSWRSTVEKCEQQRPCSVSVWPGGTDWTFDLKHK